MNVKTIEIYLKRNLSADEIATKMGFSSVEDLRKFLEKTLSSSNYEYYWKRIKHNKKKKSEKQQKQHEVEATNSANIAVDEDVEPLNQPMDEQGSELSYEQSGVYKFSLAELLKEEARLQQETAAQEIVVKDTIQQYHNLLKKVTSARTDIQKLQLTITELLNTINDYEDEALLITESHNVEIGKLHELQDSLKEVRTMIEARSTISIYVCDAEIIAEQDDSPIEIQISESWKDVREELIARTDNLLENLKLRQVTQLAQLLCIKTEFTSITFESSDLEHAYYAVHS